MLCEYCEHDEEHHIIQEECVITGCTCFTFHVSTCENCNLPKHLHIAKAVYKIDTEMYKKICDDYTPKRLERITRKFVNKSTFKSVVLDKEL